MKPIMKTKPKHVDDFIDDYTLKSKDERYARWVLNHFRLSADLKCAFHEFMKEHKLFCTYNGKRYRVTGASTMGDVWLREDFNNDDGYDIDGCVNVSDCSNWSYKP